MNKEGLCLHCIGSMPEDYYYAALACHNGQRCD